MGLNKAKTRTKTYLLTVPQKYYLNRISSHDKMAFYIFYDCKSNSLMQYLNNREATVFTHSLRTDRIALYAINRFREFVDY